MGWFENFGESATNPDNITKNMFTLGGYSLWDSTLPGYGGPDKNKGPYIPTAAENAASRAKDLETGYARGQKEFYDDPDMQSLRSKREDLAKGYDGEQLGALREQARSDLGGQQSKYLQQLSSNLAKGGVGGARSAAMQQQANLGFAGKRAEQERLINIDQAKQVNQGTNSLQDFIFRQKYGKMGTGIGEAELGVADRNASMQAQIANKEKDKSLVDRLTGGIF